MITLLKRVAVCAVATLVCSETALGQDQTVNGNLYVTGRVGVGTTTTLQDMVFARPLPWSTVGVLFQNADSGYTATDGFFFGMGGGEEGFLYNYENSDLRIGTNGFPRIIVKNNGLVGIGTVTPVAQLTVANAQGYNAAACVFQNGDTGLTAGDGLFVGIDSAETAHIHYYENQDLKIGSNNTTRMTIKAGGNVGIGTSNPTTLLEVAGEVKMTVANITGGSDLAERFEVKTPVNVKASPMPGMVVCIDPVNPGELVLSSKAYDKTVAGIISGAGGLNTGMMMGQNATLANGAHPVALTGRVYCHADAAQEPITPGDLLTTSDVPGHAMKVTDHANAMGSVIGKAMTPLAKGKQGLVMVLVSLQ